MRRAAEAARNGRPAVEQPLDVPELDPAEVTSDVFPIEDEPRDAAPQVPVSPVLTDRTDHLRPSKNGHHVAADLAAEAVLTLPATGGPAVAPAPVATPGLAEHLDSSLREKVVIDENMMPASREQYRRLAAALHNAQASTGVKVVMIASAVPSEGKTLTAANLALTLSESYRRNVLLIDADLRRPSLHTIFKVRGAPGLNEGLTAPDEPKLPLHDVSPRLTILPAGMPNSDPMAGLTSRRMQSLIDEAREAFAWVIIDTPPVGLLTDANLLASMVDGAVLVVKAGSTPYDLVKRAVDIIGPAKLLGVVLNRAAAGLGKFSYQYTDYYHRVQTPGVSNGR
jgi:capsular exopolysaccharide synthesis family protein